MSTANDDSRPPRGMWPRALYLADRTPESRNRYVDFLRALSILAVVVGHWLISAPYFLDHEPAYAHLLDLEPWTRWLTWLFQVMPVFFFVWLTVHQLGYAWQDRRLAGAQIGVPFFFVGILSLLALTHLGPYPLSLVGVPSDEISNTLPPKLPLLALAAAQIGLLLSFEPPARSWLAHRIPWAATILVNGMIMTIYLWHSTVMMLLVGLAFWQLPSVLAPYPATAAWWWTRPLWIGAYAAACLPFLLLFSRFERPEAGGRPAPAWRQLLGCTVACAGLATLALGGIGGDDWLGLRWIPLLLPPAGAAIAGFGPIPWLIHAGRPGRAAP